MPSLLSLLPPPPPNFQRFAFHGLPLLLPTTWNLRSHHGTPKSGALFFADLTQIRLELRWRTPSHLWPLRPNPHRLLQRTLAKLRKRGQGSFSSRQAYTQIRRTDPHSTTLLLPHQDQLLELHWPATEANTPPEHLPLIAHDFTTSLALLAPHPARLWSVYGATGDIPTSLSPKSLSMLPGHTRLLFQPTRLPLLRPHRIILGSYSRADHLLANTTLPKWAVQTFPFLQNRPATHLPWELSPNSAYLTLQSPRPLRRPLTHTFTLHHNQPLNLIQYTHTIE